MSTDQAADAKEKLRNDALHYHRYPQPGKLEVVATKPLANQRDLALAYSPGVAAACDAIVADPLEAATVTGRGNLVAVVSNGTAVLGLGAIVVAAAVVNALSLVRKKIDKVKLVSTGGGAAGIACLNQLLALGLKRENVILSDHKGVVFKGRTEDMTDQKAEYAADTKARTLAEAIKDADVFLGLSAPGILTGDMVKSMAKTPIILALANPEPEIRPEVAREAAPDAIIATGREIGWT